MELSCHVLDIVGMSKVTVENTVFGVIIGPCFTANRVGPAYCWQVVASIFLISLLASGTAIGWSI
jgi:hypothetical protein